MCSRRRQVFDGRCYIGKVGEGRKIGVDILIQEEIRSSVELLYAFNGIHVCIRPHAFSMSSESDDFKVQVTQGS